MTCEPRNVALDHLSKNDNELGTQELYMDLDPCLDELDQLVLLICKIKLTKDKTPRLCLLSA